MHMDVRRGSSPDIQGYDDSQDANLFKSFNMILDCLGDEDVIGL
jgi:hypothetical protein